MPQFARSRRLSGRQTVKSKVIIVVGILASSACSGSTEPSPRLPSTPATLTPTRTTDATISFGLETPTSVPTTKLPTTAQTSTPSLPSTPTLPPTPSAIQLAELQHAAGLILVEDGLLDEAIVAFTDAIRLNPLNAESFYNRGRAHGDLNQLQLAIDDFNEAIRLDPQYGDPYRARGFAFGLLQQAEPALLDFSEAIRLNPQDGFAYILRGAEYVVLGQTELAKQDFDFAIELNPEDSDAYYARGQLYTRLEDFQKAIADFDEVIRLDPDAASYYARGKVHGLLGQLNRAIQDYTDAIQLDDQFAEAYFNRAVVYGVLRRYQEIVADSSDAIRLDPQNGDAYQVRALAYGALGRLVEAQLDADRAVELGSEDATATQQQIKELSTPQYLPSLEDFRAVAYNRIDAWAMTFDPPQSGRFYKDQVDDLFSGYVAVYVASECLEGRVMSFDGFRSFVNQTLLMSRTIDSVDWIKVTAERVISEIIVAGERATSPTTDGCMGPFLYPETPTESALATELVLSIGMPYMGFFLEFVPKSIRDDSYKWFDPSIGDNTHFLTWLCERQEGRCQVAG